MIDMKKKGILVALLATLAITVASCSNKDSEHNITKKEITIYESENKNYKVNAYYVDDIDAPYLKLDELLPHRMTKQFEDGIPLPDLKLEYSSGVLKANNNYHNKVYTLEFNSKNDTIKSKDYLKAADIFNYGLPQDALGADWSPITISTAKELEDSKNETVFDLGKYGIDLVSYEKTVLIPLYILNNIYFPVGEKSFVYNGKDIYLSSIVTKSSGTEPLSLSFYRVKSIDDENKKVNYENGFNVGSKYNEATIKFNRGAILETFNDFFGRKDGLAFDLTDYSKLNDSYKLLSSDNPYDVFEGLGLLAENVDDLHTNILCPGANAGSPYLNPEVNVSFNITRENGLGFRAKSFRNSIVINSAVRESLLGDKANAGFYYEGNTLFIRFDSFRRASNKEVFTSDGKLNKVDYSKNTFNLFYDAFNDLKNHPEIKNIVIDESINGGGDMTTLVELAGFFMEEVKVLFKNKITNQIFEASYKVDTNLDGKYDTNDFQAKNYDVYLMCSESSFSCGNALPTVFSYNNAGTIIGRTSAGGSCVVFETA